MPDDARPSIPFAGEFTPGQLGSESIFDLLAIVREKEGIRQDVVEVIRARWFASAAEARTDPEERLRQQRTRAGNVVIGMRSYGLINDAPGPLKLSALGEEVLSLCNDKQAGLDAFCSFLLRERHGVELLEFASHIRERFGSVSKAQVDAELVERGFRVPTNSGNSGKLRAWLSTSGVVDDKWVVDATILRKLSGITLDDLADWRLLSEEQQATVKALKARSLGTASPVTSIELLDLLRSQGTLFDAAQTKRKIYKPLAKQGWITHIVGRAGRGGKGGLIQASAKTLELDLSLVDGLQLGSLPAELQQDLGKPLDEIFDDLGSDDTHVKGLALELLALRLSADAGLIPTEMRLRGIETGGAEVDLVAEGAHLQFSRWLFQCKNTPSTAVGLSVLAKEIGMATLLKAHVVAIVTTGTFAWSVRDFARQVIQATPIQVVLLDAESLKQYRQGGMGALRRILHDTAAGAMTSKREQLENVPRED